MPATRFQGVLVTARRRLIEEELGHAFDGLNEDIAGEAVHHGDIGDVMGDLAGLDVPDEVQVAGAKGAVHLDDELVAFGVFLADGNEADAGRPDAMAELHYRGAHVRVLDEVGGAGVGIGADVENHGGA